MLHFVKQAETRKEVTDRYGLKADEKNQVRALCCINCDLLQQDKEIVAREKERLVMDQPKKEDGMAYGTTE